MLRIERAPPGFLLAVVPGSQVTVLDSLIRPKTASQKKGSPTPFISRQAGAITGGGDGCSGARPNTCS